MKKLWLVLIFFMLPCFAAEDYYPFKTSGEQQRFATLTAELRCLVCQNQTLAESNAPLADDLRKQIYQQMQHGQSNQEIVAYLVARYGDFILYKPPFNAMTLGLWLGPFIVLIIGLSYLVYYIRRKQRDSK